MMLHHEIIATSGATLLSLLAWATLTVNAAVYYAKRAWRRVVARLGKGGK